MYELNRSRYISNIQITHLSLMILISIISNFSCRNFFHSINVKNEKHRRSLCSWKLDWFNLNYGNICKGDKEAVYAVRYFLFLPAGSTSKRLNMNYEITKQLLWYKNMRSIIATSGIEHKGRYFDAASLMLSPCRVYR